MNNVLQTTLDTVKNFGFDYVGWRTQLPLPMTQKTTLAINISEDEYQGKCRRVIMMSLWG